MRGAALVRWCGKAWVLLARACFFCTWIGGAAQAHFDGDPSQPQHRYRYSTSTPWREDPIAACQDETNSSSSYQSTSWDASNKLWKCRLSNSFGQPTDVAMDEQHCADWDEQAPACTTMTTPCAILAGIQETWDTNRIPFGINLPNDDGIQEPLTSHRGCAMKLVGWTNNGECLRVTYYNTGAEAIDEDGRPLASNQGDLFTSSVPPFCDPATGNTTNVGSPVTTNTCLGRAGSRTVVSFNFDPVVYPEPPDAPEWVCLRSCKAITDGSPAWGSTNPPTAWIGLAGGDGGPPNYGEVQYIFPFEDHPNFGSCVTGTKAPTLLTPRGSGTGEQAGSGSEGSGNSGGGGTDVSGVEDRLDQLIDTFGECDPSRGDICGEGNVDGEVERGDPGLEAMDGVAEDGMGQAEAGALDDDAPAWSEPLTGWASGAGAGCQPLSGSVMGVTFDIDLCEWAERTRTVLYFMFAMFGAMYCFEAWRRASEV